MLINSILLRIVSSWLNLYFKIQTIQLYFIHQQFTNLKFNG